MPLLPALILHLGLIHSPLVPTSPQELPWKIALDPGHGGEDQGARGRKGLKEKDVCLELSLAVSEKLKAQGLDVTLTRSQDVFVPLWERAKWANEQQADLFLSLHVNAARSRGARGSEVYFLSLGKASDDAKAVAELENTSAGDAIQDPVAAILEDLSQKAYLQESERLAINLLGQLNQLSGIRQRGVKQAPFVVLRGAAMPAVLVEAAFISNIKEEEKLKDKKFLDKVAQAITQGILTFLIQTQQTPKRKALPGG